MMTTLDHSERPAGAGETVDGNPGYDPTRSHPVPPSRAARTGKIARLPDAVREGLNRRLRDGEPGKDLVAWLNGLPEVSALLALSFEGRAITEQNLSEWRAGGYREWLHWEKTRALAQDFGHQLLTGDRADSSMEALLTHLSVLYASLTCDRLAAANPEEGLRLLRRAFVDLCNLRRDQTRSARLDFEKRRRDNRLSDPIRPDPTTEQPTAPPPEPQPPKTPAPAKADPRMKAETGASRVNPTQSDRIGPRFPLRPASRTGKHMEGPIQPSVFQVPDGDWQPMDVASLRGENSIPDI